MHIIPRSLPCRRELDNIHLNIAENLPSAFNIITILDWKFEMVSTNQNIQTSCVKMSVCLICFLRHLIVRASGHLHRLSADCKRYKGFKKPSQNGTNI